MKKFFLVMLGCLVLAGVSGVQAGPVQRIAANMQQRQQARQERRQQVVQHVQQAAPVRTFAAGVADAVGDTFHSVGKLVLPSRTTCGPNGCR